MLAHHRSAPPEGAFRFATALGEMAVAWRGDKVISTQLPEENEKLLLQHLRQKTRNPTIAWSETAPPVVEELVALIQRHLEGHPQHFPLRIFALEKISPFFRKVYECAHAIAPGKVLTYGELAAAAGSPHAARAVGQAMARNPFPLVIPCHRVVGGGTQGLVGFSAHGGVHTKSRLLQLESYEHRGYPH